VEFTAVISPFFTSVLSIDSVAGTYTLTETSSERSCRRSRTYRGQ
jgi:hypothetical protein